MPTIQTASTEKVHSDLRTQTTAGLGAEGSPKSTVRTSEASSGLPAAGSTAEREGRAHGLQAELAALEPRFVAVGERLSQALGEFQKEIVPDGGLGADLTQLQADFDTFRARVAELAASLSVSAAEITGPRLGLAALRQALRDIDEAERRKAFRELQDRAASELKCALGLVYRGNPGFVPLEECKDVARRLLGEIAASEWPRLSPECGPLAEGRHAVSRLLDLVRHGEELSDSDCEAAVEAVSAAFGRPLAIAAVRGRLSLEAGTKTPAAVERCPTCGAELDPGASFCGECGVKIP